MSRKRSGSTRDKLLSAAADVFVEKGFRDATVAEICGRAGANVSAVSYYFGSKEALYQEAWRHSYAESLGAHPQDGGISEDAPPEERLRGHLRALIERIFDENNRDFHISRMEIVNPTGLLQEVMKVALIPQREKTLSLVRELLGPEATERQVVFCEACIIGMCLNPLLMRRARQREDVVATPAGMDDLGGFAEHVAMFALAGIAATRNHL
jgi:AcrR family transcriptional regulator